MTRAALLLCVLAACEAYAPGSFASPARVPFPGVRTTIGCVELAIEMPVIAQQRAPVVHYSFGNRCAHSAMFDLSALVVSGRTADGTSIPLVPFDPAHELRALVLDGAATGGQTIEYDGASVTVPAPAEASRCAATAEAIEHVRDRVTRVYDDLASRMLDDAQRARVDRQRAETLAKLVPPICADHALRRLCVAAAGGPPVCVQVP